MEEGRDKDSIAIDNEGNISIMDVSIDESLAMLLYNLDNVILIDLP